MAATVFASLGGKMAEVIGIRRTFLICSPFIALGWVLVGTYVSTFWMFMGRALSGIGVAIVMVSPSVYIAETAHPDCRTTLNAISGLAFSLGVCILWFLGYALEWQTVAFSATLSPILSFIGFLFLPDTPYWLVRNQEIDKAFAALKYFRGNDKESEVIDEFEEILRNYQQQKTWSHLEKLKSMRSLRFVKPFLCIGILYPLYELGGMPAITNYLQSIIVKSKLSMEPRTCTLVLGIVRILASIMTMCSIQKMPPKLAYVAFAVIKSGSLLAMGVCFLLQTYLQDISDFTWVPYALLFPIYISHTVLFPLNWMLIGELFPSELRNFAAGFIECIAYIVTFAMLKLYSQMKHSLGLHGVFFFYAISGAVCALYAALTIPDNRGKTLSEIEKSYDCKTPLINRPSH